MNVVRCYDMTRCSCAYKGRCIGIVDSVADEGCVTFSANVCSRLQYKCESEDLAFLRLRARQLCCGKRTDYRINITFV